MLKKLMVVVFLFGIKSAFCQNHIEVYGVSSEQSKRILKSYSAQVSTLLQTLLNNPSSAMLKIYRIKK